MGFSMERPILLSPRMIRATRAGLKRQTRRVIRPQPPEDFTAPEEGFVHCFPDGRISGRQRFVAGADASGEMIVDVRWEDFPMPCPYGVPGTVLWVRETWAAHWLLDDFAPREIDPAAYDPPINLWYRADEGDVAPGRRGRWRSPIHMPRWAARLLLRVTDVRVERLQEISEADAMAEGVFGLAIGAQEAICAPRAAFEDLWDSINGPRGYGWEANPWAWAISFEVLP